MPGEHKDAQGEFLKKDSPIPVKSSLINLKRKDKTMFYAVFAVVEPSVESPVVSMKSFNSKVEAEKHLESRVQEFKCFRDRMKSYDPSSFQYHVKILDAIEVYDKSSKPLI
jgi:hypothetical protein